MEKDFHKEMNKYLKNRRKGLFSYIHFRAIGKKEEAAKEITQGDVNELMRKKGIKTGLGDIEEGRDNGWKEINLEELQGKGKDLNVEEAKRLVELSNETINRERPELERGNVRKAELEEGIKVLKEKQRIEEDRLAELRKARRREQMEALKGRVLDILFKKKPTIKKDMGEEVVKEIRREIKAKEAEKQRVGVKLEKPKEGVAKAEEMKEETPKESIGKEQEPKKSFFSNFIQIRTAAEIAKEEEERLKREEEQALKDRVEINELFQGGEEEARTNMPAEEQNVNISTLFPDGATQSQMQSSEDVIELDKGYKIKVVKN